MNMEFSNKGAFAILICCFAVAFVVGFNTEPPPEPVKIDGYQIVTINGCQYIKTTGFGPDQLTHLENCAGHGRVD